MNSNDYGYSNYQSQKHTDDDQDFSKVMDNIIPIKIHKKEINPKDLIREIPKQFVQDLTKKAKVDKQSIFKEIAEK